jgi:predicted ATPase/class 3 adenylate cyclase/Tfp pilus assembly protein PilF
MSEVRALLLTDVVDSTQLAERLGDAAAADLGAAHDRVARDLLRAWRGREIDKTDGMLMLFDAAADALGFAAAYHAALAAMPVPLKARAGLHVGPVILRANPPEDVAHGAKPLEVEGIAKPVAARVMSLALGGQTLLTAEARAALGASALRVQSHGFWRIKGIAEPVELFEAGDERAPFLPPPDSAKVYRVVRRDDLWLPLREVAHGLPAERDAFIGRQDALAELARRFHMGARLVSVLGVGGTGKTRLATRFGWTWLGDFPGGAWFCDLSQARNVDGLVHAVAQGLDVPLGKDDPVVQLGHAIAGRGRCLVILDNFEQVARHAGDTLGRWLDRAVGARFLVTTREVLGLPGEEALALAPLGVTDAVALFRQRAASAKHDFKSGAEDNAAIAQLVKLLDGLPLAIELAAARVRVMSPSTLLSRMDQRFRLLATMGGRQDRQATLRATFDWSWDLLNDAEKAALAQLSVFEGGFTLQAAEAVLDLTACADPPWAVDVVHSLVDKSFVRPGSDARFDMLVSVQEYAAEHLSAPGHYTGSGPGGAVAAQVRHGCHFGRPGQAATATGAGADLENIVVACRRAVTRDDGELAVNLLERAWTGLKLQGPYQVATDLASRVLDMSKPLVDVKARAHWVAGNAMHHSGHDAQAYAQFEAALLLSRERGHQLGEAQAQRILGDLDMGAGSAQSARSRFRAAMSAARRLGDDGLLSDVQNSLGNLAEDLGQIDDAQAHYESALTSARAVGDRQREGAALGNLAVLCSHQGRLHEALDHNAKALAAAHETGNRRLEGNTLCNRGLLLELLGDAANARHCLEQALDISRTLGNAYLESNVLCNLGIVCESLTQPDAAEEHYEAAAALAHTLGDRHSEGQFLGYLGLLHARRARHGQARDCLDAGQALLESALDRIGLGVLLCSRAEAAHLAGEPQAAQAALNAALAIGTQVGAGEDSELGKALKNVQSLLGTTAA